MTPKALKTLKKKHKGKIFLFCLECNGRFSANPADYCFLAPNEPLTHCGQMVVGRIEKTVLIPLEES